VAASRCVYAEEGMVTPQGFAPIDAMGFELADFCEGNAVPCDPALLDRLAALFVVGPIATVATCSGTDAAAREVAARTHAVAEAMEGAAVVHAARRLGVPGGELRAISNTTGDRDRQRWDLPRALGALGDATSSALDAIRA
jgi:futalosine hydrolase